MTNPIQEGKEASELLEDIEGHLRELEQELKDMWGDSKSTEDREELWYTLRGLQLFNTALTAKIQSGLYEMGQRPEEE